ncbi:MAG: NAD(P)-dependent oxidoreductase [Candidatus Methanoculleus thermohydrogenotrophicum]
MDLAGKTLGLIGTGRTSPATCSRTRTLPGTTASSTDLADLLSLHVPYTKATHHLINAERLRLVKDTALLVNTSRGGVVDTRAVAGALREGRLGGRARCL